MHRRIKLILQYDGAPFQGWQLQSNGPSVQGALEDALLKLIGSPVRVIAAGRTDAGVHAAAMPVHFDLDHPIPPGKIAVALSQFLPDSVGVLQSSEVHPDWDARRSARLRWYRYQVLMSSVRKPLGPRAWRVFRKLNLEKIHEALALLEGKHDFQGFRSSQCQAKRSDLTLQQATLAQNNDLIAFDFKCRSFLHHMVRFMVGTLISVGHNQIDLKRLRRILEHGDRPQLALCAPPEGLCLMQVGYTADECRDILAQRPLPPSF